MTANPNPNHFFNNAATLIDFNGDGKTDIFWRNPNTAENSVWLMNGTFVASKAVLPTLSPDWDYSIADFNSDGKTDIFWRNQNTGENATWIMNGTNATGTFLPTLDTSTEIYNC